MQHSLKQKFKVSNTQTNYLFLSGTYLSICSIWDCTLMLREEGDQHLKVKRVTGKLHLGEDSLGVSNYNSPCAIDCRFANLSTVTLYIVNRLGVITKLEPNPKPPYTSSLICRMEFRNYRSNLSVPPGHESELNNALRNNIAANRGGAISIEEEISVDEIVRNRHGIYIQHFDVYVTQYEEQAREYNHPSCPQKIHNDYIQLGMDYVAEHVIQIGVRIIDNDGTMGPMYTVIHGEVMKIVPVEKPELKSGLYITGLNALTSTKTSGIREDVFYSFEEVKKGNAPIKLYKHFIDAKESIEELTLRSKEHEALEKEREREHKERIAKLKQEQELEAQVWAREKHEMDIAKRKADEDLQRLEGEFARLKARRDEEFSESKFYREMTASIQQMQHQQAKHESDMRSMQAKQTVETIKTVGLIITGLLSIYAIVQKAQK